MQKRSNKILRQTTLGMAIAFSGIVASHAAPMFSVVSQQPVHAVVAVPEPAEVTALYYGAQRNDTSTPARDWQASAAGILVSDNLEPTQAWFRAVYEDGSEQIVGPRHIPKTQGRNFRDLGGYETTDGRRVRGGLLYRSGVLNGLNQEQRSQIEALGIRHICDFRSALERDEMPDPELPGAKQIEGCQDSASSATDMEAFGELLQQAAAGKNVDWHRVMVGSYQGMGERYANAYKAMFNQLLSHKEQPLLFHCTGGKDRTGVAAALILSALGVPEDTIIADYTMSEVDPVDVGDDFQSKAYPAEMLNQPALKATEPEYIEAALAGIRQRYGSIDAYLTQALGLSQEDREQLRQQLLTPAR